jgi:phosphoribosylamine--glycine ligase
VRVLVVGSGGREHALAYRLKRSPQRPEVICAPGNPGMGVLARCVPVGAEDVEGIVKLAEREKAELAVVGPEKPLLLGLADRLREAGVPVFGPSRAAAQVEASKAFAKELMARAGIPTAEYAVFDDPHALASYAAARDGRVVLKADGLAAGKGVYVCRSMDEVHAALRELMVERVHGEAGARVVAEELLEGKELSLIVLSDGERAVALPTARDYKRVHDGDRGPNTGGMGAFSPADEDAGARAFDAVVPPALKALRDAGTPFAGALYAGLMLTAKGVRVLEFNARFGDPETQPLMMRCTGDLPGALLAAAQGDLRAAKLSWDPRPAVCVVAAAEGYPGKPRTGDAIEGLSAMPEDAEVQVFHAGTAAREGRLVTAGGRVLGITALGKDLAGARARAYAAAERIQFKGKHYRRDVAAV